MVVAAGAVEILVNLLTSTDPELLEASTKALANLLKPTQSQIKAVRLFCSPTVSVFVDLVFLVGLFVILGRLCVVRTFVALFCGPTIVSFVRSWISSRTKFFLFFLHESTLPQIRELILYCYWCKEQFDAIGGGLIYANDW